MFDMKKAMELKKMMEDITARLETISVDGEAGDGKYQVTATVTATKKVTNISISDELMQQGDKEYIEDLVVTALNRALEKAQNVSGTEGRNAAMGGMFGI
ncbi:MAG: YbaB/EbfC family nucleoid-associated protein [Chitinophagales bacterium]|nr:YbaB/EbfC family nucleoid-associated protein [Chitinophagales bacterium]